MGGGRIFPKNLRASVLKVLERLLVFYLLIR